jgi:hypothetical protein
LSLRFKRVSVVLLLVVAAVLLAGCGGGGPAATLDKGEPRVQDAAPSGHGTGETTPGESEIDAFGEKDLMASAGFADYLHQNFGGADRPWWYASITDFPEVRTGSQGTIGVITMHIIPSDRSKTDEIISNIASAARRVPAILS